MNRYNYFKKYIYLHLKHTKTIFMKKVYALIVFFAVVSFQCMAQVKTYVEVDSLGKSTNLNKFLIDNDAKVIKHYTGVSNSRNIYGIRELIDVDSCSVKYNCSCTPSFMGDITITVHQLPENNRVQITTESASATKTYYLRKD